MLQDVDTAVGVQYIVTIDRESLGSFSSCEGIGCEVVFETREEGGNNEYVWQLPTRLKFPNVKLTRPLGSDSTQIATWISGMTRGCERQTANIRAMTRGGQVVAEWALHDVVPVRWTGPQMSPDQPKVLTETLEIAHHGFLPTGSGGGAHVQ